jgi:alpha-glucosidase
VRYRIKRHGKLLIAPSLLGFALTDSYPMQRGFEFQGSETASSDTTWEQPWGERRFVRSHYTELLAGDRLSLWLAPGGGAAIRLGAPPQ